MMKRTSRNIQARRTVLQLLVIAFAVFYITHVSSCARTMQGPVGGPKDTIPPVVVSMKPAQGSTNFPIEKGRIVITFNEYVQVKEPTKFIVLSPPLKKNPEYRMKGKSLVFKFPLPLDSNTTYCLDWGGAVSDNNEGNKIGPYAFAFSTGNSIDSMLLSGRVYDNEKLTPMEGVTVMLYENPRDSSVFLDQPSAIARSDKWGYFCIRNIKDTEYAIYAVKDESGNHLYDPGYEMIGFPKFHKIRPTAVVRDSMPQLAFVADKDTLADLSRPSDVNLFLFKEKPTQQFIKEYKRFSDRGCYIKFNAPNVRIDSFSIRGVPRARILREINPTHDSLNFWINIQRKLPDTLFLGIKYRKTDTTGRLVSTVENLKLIAPKKKSDDSSDGNNNDNLNGYNGNNGSYGNNRNNRNGNNNRNEKKKKKEADEKKPTRTQMTLTADPNTVEQDGWILEFKDPLIKFNTDSIFFTSKTPRGVVSKVKFKISRDRWNIKKFIIRPEEALKVGNEYEMLINRNIFKDINGLPNDSLYNKITLPTDDKLSSMVLEVKGVTARYKIELVNERMDKVYRTYYVTSECSLNFPYITAGRYRLRISEDRNNNGMLDPGSVLKHQQPETVKLFLLEDGKDSFYIPERTDLSQTLDISKLFELQ